MNGSTATAEQLETLASEGFVALGRFVHGEALQELLANVDRFVRDVVPALPPDQVFYEDKSRPETLKQIQGLGSHDAWFQKLFMAGGFRNLAERALHGPVVPRNLQYFNKPPRQSRPTPPHQDGFYFMLDPCEAVTMWLALDRVDKENGCVRYVRGSHKQGMRSHARTQTLGFSQGIADYPTLEDLSREVAVPAEPGDLLVHHAMTIHRADGNGSPTRSRRALGFVYFSERARENAEAKAAYQRQLTEDMRAQGKI
jgi:phytanoyl-CoA hydroxylase